MNQDAAGVDFALRPLIKALATEIVAQLRQEEKPSEAPGPLLVGRKQGASMLAISEGLFRGLEAAGEIVGVEITGRGRGERRHCRFSVEQLRDWIRRREAERSNDPEAIRRIAG